MAAIKGTIIAVLVGSAGATTIAIPATYAYGKSQEDYKGKPLKEEVKGKEAEKTGLINKQNELEEQKKVAVKAREDAQKELTQKEGEMETLQKQKQTWESGAATAKTYHDNIQKNHSAVKQARDKAVSERDALQNQINTINQQITEAKQNTEKARQEAIQEVNNYIKNILEKTTAKIETDQDKYVWNKLHPWLEKHIGNGMGELEDTDSHSWKCRQYETDTNIDDAKAGMAYCVLTKKNPQPEQEGS